MCSGALDTCCHPAFHSPSHSLLAFSHPFATFAHSSGVLLVMLRVTGSPSPLFLLLSSLSLSFLPSLPVPSSPPCSFFPFGELFCQYPWLLTSLIGGRRPAASPHMGPQGPQMQHAPRCTPYHSLFLFSPTTSCWTHLIEGYPHPHNWPTRRAQDQICPFFLTPWGCFLPPLGDCNSPLRDLPGWTLSSLHTHGTFRYANRSLSLACLKSLMSPRCQKNKFKLFTKI